MTLAAKAIWRGLAGSDPARVLCVSARGPRQWAEAMGHIPGTLRGLSLQDGLLPEPDLAVLLDPLQATGLGNVPLLSGRQASESLVQTSAKPRIPSEAPQPCGLEQAAFSGPEQQEIRPAAKMSGYQTESGRLAMEDARRAGDQPARLAVILQRYAGSASQPRAEAHFEPGRGDVAAGQVNVSTTPQRPAPERKIVYLPVRTAATVSMPDRLRVAEDAVRREANVAATLKSWAQAEGVNPVMRGVVPTVAGRRPPGAERDTPMSLNKWAEFSAVAASAQPSASVPTSSAPLTQALLAAMPPLAERTESPRAAEQPVIESLTRIAEQLTSIEMKFSQAANVAPGAAVKSVEDPLVQWLEDDDLAGRLQGILRRQARRRGIDLS